MSFRNLVITLLGVCLLSGIVFYVVHYVEIDLRVKSNANISRDKPGCYSPKIAIDSKDVPHVMWEAMSGNSYERGYETEYVKWDGQNWIDEKGNKHRGNVTLGEDDLNIGSVADIIIDENDTIHVLGNNNKVSYLKLDGDKWKSVRGDVYKNGRGIGNIYAGGRPSMALDKNGFPVIASESIVSASVDKSFILFARWNGEEWIPRDGKYAKKIDTAYYDSFYVNLTLDSDDTPYIFWKWDSGVSKNELCLIKFDGTNWVNIDGEIYDPYERNATLVKSNVSISTGDMKTDSKGNLHIMFSHTDDAETTIPTYIIYDGENFKYLDGKIFDPENLKTASVIEAKIRHSDYSFVLDSNDNPHVVWEGANTEHNSKDIFYARWDGKNWVTAGGSSVSNPQDFNVSLNNGRSYLPSVALDSNDFPHIVWSEGSFWGSGDNDILYLKWNCESWVCADGTPYKPSKYKGE